MLCCIRFTLDKAAYTRMKKNAHSRQWHKVYKQSLDSGMSKDVFSACTLIALLVLLRHLYYGSAVICLMDVLTVLW